MVVHADSVTWIKHCGIALRTSAQKSAYSRSKSAPFSRSMHVSLVHFLTNNGIPGTRSLLVLILILFFLYFSGKPGGASEGPAAPPRPESVGKALQCVRLIGVWRATSKNQQHD